jgi:ElaB/YqjD/DUF883 family membrane-anchored ribosome-binding protein
MQGTLGDGPDYQRKFMESKVETEADVNELRNPTTEKLLNELKTTLQRVQQRTVERAKATDQVIREHPYETIGIAFGLGVLIGFLIRRK